MISTTVARPSEGHPPSPPPWSPWAHEYARTPDRYVLGTDASSFARETVRRLGLQARVLDLGCGEGRDSVFFAEQGSQVTGLDSSPEGLEKASRLARGRNVTVRWIREALPRLPVEGPFDLVYSCGSLHYVAREERALLFHRLHRLTAPGGGQAHVVFTDRHIHPEKGEVVDYFAPGELRALFEGWTVLASREGVIACAGDGRPHVHSVEEVFARRPRETDA